MIHNTVFVKHLKLEKSRHLSDQSRAFILYLLWLFSSVGYVNARTGGQLFFSFPGPSEKRAPMNAGETGRISSDS